VTARGKKVTIKEYFSPMAAHRCGYRIACPEVNREKVEQKHTMNSDDAFLKFLEHVEEQNRGTEAQAPRRESQRLDVEPKPNPPPLHVTILRLPTL
jgi:hypothetical protein